MTSVLPSKDKARKLGMDHSCLKRAAIVRGLLLALGGLLAWRATRGNMAGADKEVAPLPPDGKHRVPAPQGWRFPETNETKVVPLPPDDREAGVGGDLRSSGADEEVAPRLPDGKLRVLVSRGCSGSSFVGTTLRQILDAHGYVVAQEKMELYKARKNSMFDRAKERAPAGASDMQIMVNATVMLHENRVKRGETLLFKWKASLDPFVDRVGRENVLSGVMIRENVLDRIVCGIRDCFEPVSLQLGYPVVAGNGSRTDLCLSRRFGEGGQRTVAHFPPARMGAVVQYLRKEALQVARFQERAGASLHEALTAFEYTAEGRAVAASMEAWCALAGRFVEDGLDCGIVADLLRPQIDSRNASFHEDVIDNYEEVFGALRAAGLGGYIRSRG